MGLLREACGQTHKYLCAALRCEIQFKVCLFVCLFVISKAVLKMKCYLQASLYQDNPMALFKKIKFLYLLYT